MDRLFDVENREGGSDILNMMYRKSYTKVDRHPNMINVRKNNNK